MKREKLKWFKLLYFVPLLGILVLTNVGIDPGNMFHNVGRDVADSFMAGNDTYVSSANLNERRVKERVIATMPDEVECIIMGSSTVTGISRPYVGTESFYNLFLSGADYYDIMAQFGLMEVYGKSAKRIILCMDTNFFDKKLYDSYQRNVTYKPYAQYMIDILNNGEPKEPRPDDRAENLQKLIQMFSLTYFQSCIDYMNANGKVNMERWGIVDVTYGGTYYQTDGSMIYDVYYQSRTAEDVRAEAADYSVDYYFTPYEKLSAESKDTFEKLLAYLGQCGVEVDLFISPLSPALWDRCNPEVNSILWETESFVNEVAAQYNLDVMGSFNPYTVGVTDEAFYDCRHMRHESLAEFFNFGPDVAEY